MDVIKYKTQVHFRKAVSWTKRFIIIFANTTVMPWFPSECLVIRCPCRYLRNPMILGVVLVMVGEGLLLGSTGSIKPTSIAGGRG